MGISIESTTTVAYIYKHRYSDRQATDIAMRDHAVFFAIPKEGNLEGIDFNYVITTGNPQGIADVFSTAQAQADTLKGAAPAALPFTKYGDLVLDGPSMMRARGGKASFFDLITRSQDGILDELGADIAFNLQRDITGLRGQITSTGITGNVLTLTNKRDVEHFKRGMSIVSSTSASGAAPRTGSAKIVGLNRTNATITVDSAANITGLAVSDYLFRNGGNGSGFEGMETCTPLAVPTAGDSFRGFDRSVDAEALAGSRIDDTSRYPEEMAGDLAVEISIIGGKKITTCAVFPTVFQAMVKRLGAKVEFMAGGTADVGFETIKLQTAGGNLTVISDVDARYDRIREWRDDTHCIKHMDELVHLIRDDGRPNLRTATTDGLETRARSLLNYIQYNPALQGCGSTALT